MSKSASPPENDEPSDDRLDKLYEVHEELQLIADSDARYAKYAKNGLESLREAGYDV